MAFCLASVRKCCKGIAINSQAENRCDKILWKDTVQLCLVFKNPHTQAFDDHLPHAPHRPVTLGHAEFIFGTD